MSDKTGQICQNWSVYKLVKTEIGHKVNVSKLYQIFSNLWWQMCVILTYAYLKPFLLFKSHNPLIIYTVTTSKYFQLKTVWFKPPHQLTVGYDIIVYPYEHSFLTTKRVQLSVSIKNQKLEKSRT